MLLPRLCEIGQPEDPAGITQPIAICTEQRAHLRSGEGVFLNAVACGRYEGRSKEIVDLHPIHAKRARVTKATKHDPVDADLAALRQSALVSSHSR